MSQGMPAFWPETKLPIILSNQTNRLEIILKNTKRHQYLIYRELLVDTKNTDDLSLIPFCELYRDNVSQYFDKKGYNNNTLQLCAGYSEAIKNAFAHSKADQTHIRLALLPKLIIFSIRDGDNYFKNKEIKKVVGEQKTT